MMFGKIIDIMIIALAAAIIIWLGWSMVEITSLETDISCPLSRYECDRLRGGHYEI